MVSSHTISFSQKESLGVETPEDIKFVTESDLISAGLNLIAIRKLLSSKEPSPKEPSRVVAQVEDVTQVTYKGVVSVTENYKPSLSCAQEVLASKLQVPNIEKIVSECKKFAESKSYDTSLLNEDELMALGLYTYDINDINNKQNNFYYIFNAMLRERSTQDLLKWRGYIYYLFSALAKIPNQKRTLYRGVVADKATIEKAYVPGRKIHWSAFSSSSTNEQKAKNFSLPSRIVFRINVLTGKDIQPFSFFPSEHELLLSPNMSLVVTNGLHEEKDNKGETFFYIDLQEILQTQTFVF